MELDTEREETEGKMHRYVSNFYAAIVFITILNRLLFFYFIFIVICFVHLSFL